MTRVLVTGGTGVLGRELVHRLQDRAEVRVLSRGAPRGPGHVQGDLETGAGLAAAVDGVDAIAHCASAADYLRPRRDVAQLRQLLDTVGSVGKARPHLVYISIVGVDRIRFGFLKAKLDAERLVEESGSPWTILRATEFHDLILMFLTRLARGPVAIVPRNSLLQPVDTGEVAERMAELVTGSAAGRVPELGGPKVESMADLMRSYLAAARRRRPVVTVPLGGRLGAGFGVGGHMLTDDDRGAVSFADYLDARSTADGVLGHPY